MMKPLYWGLLCLVLGSNAVSARDFSTIQSSKTLIAATEGSFPPFNYSKEGKLTGFEIELTDLIAQQMGLKLEWKTMGFDSLIIGVSQNKADIAIASHGITPEREKAVDFTAPHYCTGAVIVALPGGPRVRGDLAGKKVGVQLGTTYLTSLRSIPGISDVKSFPKDTDAMLALKNKKIDAWVTDLFVALEAKKKNPETKIEINQPVFEERIGIVIQKGNVALKNAIDGALKELLRNGKYAKLSTDYFGRDIRCR
jgi:polar amino acid transport system substrate-binding protein